MTILGTAGDDNLTGTSGIDDFDVSQGGDDKVFALESNDTIRFGAALTNKDRIDGGDGTDTVRLDGDYSAGLKFAARSFTSVEILHLISGHDYNLTLVDENFTGTTATITASTLGAGDSLVLDARKEADAQLSITAGAGDDIVRGGFSHMAISLAQGGSDSATGGAAFDTFNLGAAYDAGDSIVGGGDTDFLSLDGDYSTGLLITHTMMKEIEVLQLSGAFGYNITLDKKTLADATTLGLQESGMVAGQTVFFDASHSKHGTISVTDGASDDTILGTKLADFLNFTHGGVDTVDARDGDDEIWFNATLTKQDSVDGGGGYDQLKLEGDYSAGVDFKSATIHDIEEIDLTAGFSYNLITDDHNLAAGATMVVSASLLAAGQTVVFDGSQETDGSFNITAGAGDDSLTGGAVADTLAGGAGNDILGGYLGTDTITGGAGADRLNGGFGADTYVFLGVSDSTGFNCDITVSFNANVDFFDMPFTVLGIDAEITTGNLSEATFDADMAAAVGAAQLAAHHAVLFTPDGGDLAGHIYLIVESGGTAGYVTNADYAFDVDNANNLASLSTANFI